MGNLNESHIKELWEAWRTNEAMPPYQRFVLGEVCRVAIKTVAQEPVVWQWRYWYSSDEPGVWMNERRDDADNLLENNILIREDKRPLYASPVDSRDAGIEAAATIADGYAETHRYIGPDANKRIAAAIRQLKGTRK